MNVTTDFLPKVQVTETKDSSYSYSGTKDFEKPEGDVKTISPSGSRTRLRTRASLNNSYT